MIDVTAAFVRAQLEAVEAGISEAAEALDWAHGEQTLDADQLIPLPSDPQARASAVKEFNRYTRQLQSRGPRVLKIKRSGAVGEVNWGGDNTDGIDNRLEEIDLRGVARNVFDSLFVNGIAAAWAFNEERTGRNRIQVLGGYLEPLYHPDDPAGEPVGLYQVTQDPDSLKVRYRVRVYDFEDRSIREWRDLTRPTELGKPPADEWSDTSVPRLAIFDTNQAGLPVGELSQALGELRAELVQQLRILRVADAHAFPILWQAGHWQRVTEVGATVIMESDGADSKVGRVDAADLEQLFTLQDRGLERIRGDLSLPISSIGSGAWPSGEAIQQANVAYTTGLRDYAHLESRLLTDVVADYAELEGIANPPPVIVSVSREQMRATAAQQSREEYRAGGSSLRMAVAGRAPY